MQGVEGENGEKVALRCGVALGCAGLIRKD